MTPEQNQVLSDLRSAGYAIVVFSPEELRGARRRVVEDRLTELGNDSVIEDSIPERSVIACNVKTGVKQYFDQYTAHEWAAAYGYCEEHNKLGQLFAAAQEGKLGTFYHTLPLSLEQGTVSCGDWISKTEET